MDGNNVENILSQELTHAYSSINCLIETPESCHEAANWKVAQRTTSGQSINRVAIPNSLKQAFLVAQAAVELIKSCGLFFFLFSMVPSSDM